MILFDFDLFYITKTLLMQGSNLLFLSIKKGIETPIPYRSILHYKDENLCRNNCFFL